MMGMRMPETCWAVSKRQVINLWSFCILLVDSVENRHIVYTIINGGKKNVKMWDLACSVYGFIFYFLACIISSYPAWWRSFEAETFSFIIHIKYIVVLRAFFLIIDGYMSTTGYPIVTLRRLMLYIYGAPILDVSRSHTTTQHSR